MIAERSPYQDQGSQEEGVCLNDPLNFGGGCIQLRLEHRQCYVDDRAIDKGHACSEDRCYEYPCANRSLAIFHKRLSFGSALPTPFASAFVPGRARVRGVFVLF